ncbi:MAG: SGNH/GDSL hydrolase family protein [Rhodanobacter sp.]
MKRLILLLLALLPLLAHARENNHSQWDPEIAAFVAADQQHLPPPGSILFIGSSSIQHWKSLATDFPELSVINRGFGGSEINDSTFFASRIVAPYHARAIVMYAGDNDLQDGGEPEQVRDDFAAFVRTVRATNPDVPIAFIAIKPSVARAVLLPKIRQANALVRAYAATQHGVTYLDVFTPMLGKNGGPQPDLFGDDGLHMNRKGYLLWISVIKPWVDALPH